MRESEREGSEREGIRGSVGGSVVAEACGALGVEEKRLGHGLGRQLGVPGNVNKILKLLYARVTE